MQNYQNGLTIELIKNKEEFRKYSIIRYNFIEEFYKNPSLIDGSTGLPVLDRDDYNFLKTVQYTLSSFIFSEFIISLIKNYEENYKCKLC